MTIRILSIRALLCLGLFAMILQPSARAERHKVILDSDLGSDIDDAFAVALLLASPELEICGDYPGTRPDHQERPAGLSSPP